MIEVATTEEQQAELGRAPATARELGVPEEAIALSPEQVQDRCSSPLFRSGVLFRECATVQPARLARALRRSALAAGVEIHEHSRAVRVRDNRVETSDGSVRARDIVLATNAALASWTPTAPHLARFRLARRADRAGARPAPRAPLDRRGGDQRRPHVPALLPHDRGRRVLMGEGSAGGTRRHAERGLRAAPSRARRGKDHARLGRADRRLRRPPSAGRLCAVASTTPPDSRATASARRGSRRSRSRPSSCARTTSGRACRSSTATSRDCPRSEEAGGELVRRSILALEEADEEGRRRPLAARAGAALPRLTGTRLGLR